MMVVSSSYCCYIFDVFIKGCNQSAVVMNDAWMPSDGIFGFSDFRIRNFESLEMETKTNKCVSRI